MWNMFKILIVKYISVLFWYRGPYFCYTKTYVFLPFLFRRGMFLCYISLLFGRGMFLFYLEEECFSSVYFKIKSVGKFWFRDPLFGLGYPSKFLNTAILKHQEYHNITQTQYLLVYFGREWCGFYIKYRVPVGLYKLGSAMTLRAKSGTLRFS